jgi:hypothetical protein
MAAAVPDRPSEASAAPAGALTVDNGRRSFVQGSLAALGALSTLGAAAPATPLPPSASDDARIKQRPLDPALVVVFIDYLEGGAYERWQDITLMSGPSWVLRFKGMALPSGGDRVLAGSRYRLLVDGVERASSTIAVGSKSGSFTLPLAGLAEGWHWLDIATDTAETVVPWVAYMQRGSAPVPQEQMPVVLGSYGLLANRSTLVHTAMVPARFAPVTVPCTPRATPAFSEPLPRKSLVVTEIVPWRHNDLHRPRMTNGVLCTFNQQAYFFSSLAAAKYPALAVLDGPRGQGSLAMATHLEIGRTGGIYFCDPWRVGHIAPDGTIRTIAGWRHTSPAPRPFPQTEATLKKEVELVGDWSAVPARHRGFHELWGIAWDVRTLSMNENAAPIPNSGNNGLLEKPHVVGPRAFVSDSQNNRVCMLEFSAVSHAVPAKVSEFLTGLKDPWDVVCVDGVLYVSERMSHRIAAYDASTGAFLRVVVSGAPLANVTSFREVKRLATLDVIRAEKCVAPEGLYHLDGWLYFGSLAMAQIKRVNLSTGAIEVVKSIDTPEHLAGGNFIKLAVSDGTFGPRGTVFFVSWAITQGGRPLAFLPDGTPWAYAGFAAGGEGPGPVWETIDYGSAVAVGQGRMVCAASSEGLFSHSKALPTDAPVTYAETKAGRDAYHQRGLQLTHGPGGWGYYGLPVPWGISRDIDNYLSIRGHRRPASG